MDICPHCRRELRAPGWVATVFRPNTTKRAIVEALLEAGPAGLTIDRLVFRVFGHRRDGGPVSATNCIRTEMSRVRKALKPLGYEIPVEKNHQAYKLVKVEEKGGGPRRGRVYGQDRAAGVLVDQLDS